MKYKFLTLSLLLAYVCATTIKAQETNYYTRNGAIIFLLA